MKERKREENGERGVDFERKIKWRELVAFQREKEREREKERKRERGS